jgi:hypothetical protein
MQNGEGCIWSMCALYWSALPTFGECMNINGNAFLSASMYMYMDLPCAAALCTHRNIDILS